MTTRKENLQAPLILIVEDDEPHIHSLNTLLRDNDYRVSVTKSGDEALKVLQQMSPDLILMDVLMPGKDGYEICKILKADAATRDIPVIFLTGKSDTQDIIKGFQLGGADYICKPFNSYELLARVKTHLTVSHLMHKMNEEVQQRTQEIEELNLLLKAENTYLQAEIKGNLNFDDIVGGHPSLSQALHKIEQVAPTNATVLILGESGTGKEKIARAIHQQSTRHNNPMIKVNCGAIPENLVESELFGHEKGAFTGAIKQHIGRFELADKGTLFLDEVAELSLEHQVKLLRVLEEGEFQRVGGSKTLTTDVRIITATNQDFEKLIEEGRFRADLYYRLKVFPVNIPPLRDRKEDIPLLAQYFLDKYAKQHNKKVNKLSIASIERMQQHRWPGNIRELLNFIECSVIACDGNINRAISDLLPKKAIEKSKGKDGDDVLTLKEVEKDYIEKILIQTGWVVSGPKGAAQILDMNPNTLRWTTKKLGISRPYS